MNFEADSSDLNKLERDLNKIPAALEKAFWEIGKEIAIDWRAALLISRGYDSGDYFKSIAAEKRSAKSFIVEPNDKQVVFYSDIYERGRRDYPAYYGRFPALRALDRIESRDLVDIRITHEFDRILTK